MPVWPEVAHVLARLNCHFDAHPSFPELYIRIDAVMTFAHPMASALLEHTEFDPREREGTVELI